MARQEDESVRYTMPQHMLIGIAKNMPLTPVTLAGCCNPMPSLVRLYLDDLVTLINDTRLEYQVNQQARTEELAKIQQEYEEKEKSWEARKRNGPVHTVFEGEDGLARKRADINITEKETPDFGLIMARSGVDTNSKAYKAAEQVRKSLVLVAPMLPAGVGLKEGEEVKPVVVEPVPVKVVVETEPIILADVKVQERKANGKRKADDFEDLEGPEEGEASPMRIDGEQQEAISQGSGGRGFGGKKRKKNKDNIEDDASTVGVNGGGQGGPNKPKETGEKSRREKRVERLAEIIAEKTGVPAHPNPFDYSKATSAFTFVPPPIKKKSPGGKGKKEMDFKKPK
jgi:hypothetical protein